VSGASPVINLHQVELTRQKHGEQFDAHLGAIASRLGAKKLGCRLTVVPPRKRAFPFHAHHTNEELFYVLAGEGVLRFGKEQYPVRPGDVVVCPAGGAETAHQFVNTSATTDLRYLAISTMLEPDVAEYPDSNKFGVLSGAPPGGDKSKRRLSFVGRLSSNLDYYDGEEAK
jgi:uncharacterized cupin superfamily protein